MSCDFGIHIAIVSLGSLDKKFWYMDTDLLTVWIV